MLSLVVLLILLRFASESKLILTDQAALYFLLNGVTPSLAEVVSPEINGSELGTHDMLLLTKLLRRSSKSLKRFAAIEDNFDRLGPRLSQQLNVEHPLVSSLIYIRGFIDRNLRSSASQESLPFWIAKKIIPKISEALGLRISALKNMPVSAADLLDSASDDDWRRIRNGSS
eukprot:Gregarina_sp_Poly_1__93@NODE_101_length_14427_cov_132_160237_g88_i0_p8_GENE_NODE_101_length_14427_cov_132_160237_g88_i0NODE_101_length_14427_cov_132_160237_g88_i0_p8_ORF_typecomplete_len172_score24_20_NODE_101_length_14427_cov_132_160237_g88_i014841999